MGSAERKHTQRQLHAAAVTVMLRLEKEVTKWWPFPSVWLSLHPIGENDKAKRSLENSRSEMGHAIDSLIWKNPEKMVC